MKNKDDELVTILIRFIIIPCIGLLLFIIFIATLTYSNTSSVNQQQTTIEQQTVLFYKTIPVTILSIDKTYYNIKSHSYVINIKVKSQEYGLEKSFTLHGSNMGGDKYAVESYNGKIKVGDTINAELYSWKQGENIIKRELNSLVQ